MIRSPRPKTRKVELTERLRSVRSQIRTYQQPSELGERHDARVRARWNTEIEQLRTLEADIVAELATITKGTPS